MSAFPCLPGTRSNVPILGEEISELGSRRSERGFNLITNNHSTNRVGLRMRPARDAPPNAARCGQGQLRPDPPALRFDLLQFRIWNARSNTIARQEEPDPVFVG